MRYVDWSYDYNAKAQLQTISQRTPLFTENCVRKQFYFSEHMAGSRWLESYKLVASWST